MRKYICNACGIRICTAEYQSGSGIPMKCTALIDRYCKAAWQEVKEETTTKSSQLPDWVQECAIGYDNEQKRYFEVTNIDEKFVDIEYLDDGIGATCDYADIAKCSKARKRRLNDKEMKSLVGKVYKSSCCTFLVTGYDKRKKSIKVNELWFNSEELMNGKNSINPPLIDNKPCYKLEHLENGEWVE